MIVLTELPSTREHFVSMAVVEVKGSGEKSVFSAADLVVALSPDAALSAAVGQEGMSSSKGSGEPEESIFPPLQRGTLDIQAVSRQYDRFTPKDLDGLEGSIFFLLGDPGTREFGEVRKVLQDSDAYLVLMVVDDGAVSGTGVDAGLGDREALVRVAHDDRTAGIVRVVRDLVLSFRLFGVMQPSRTDFCAICSGRVFYSVFIDVREVRDMREPVSEYCDLPGITGLEPFGPAGYSAWYGAMFYSDEDGTMSIDHMAEVLDTIYSCLDFDGEGVGYASALLCPDRLPFRVTGLLAL